MIYLRKFKDEHIAVFEAWLHKPHVEKWYENSQDWIYEVKKRNSEFSWIQHFIVECDGEPVGFCQFYQYCKGGETWRGNTDLDGTYSIDYLIGEENFLRKGLGKEIVKALIEKIRNCPDSKRIIVQPEEENMRSRAVLSASGFDYEEEGKFYIYNMQDD